MGGYIMDMQNLSVNDGEGIRTIIFLAGCPLRCRWCANPEGQTQNNPMVHYAEIPEILKSIHEQDIFYRFSGGGITFSGGEATAQPEFLCELADRLYDEGYDLALETCGLFDFEAVRPALSKMDLIFMDMKHPDSETHRVFTGYGNEQILENICRTYALGVSVVIRVPVICGVNGNDRDLEAIFDFMCEHTPDAGLELLPYHTLGEQKYIDLGLPLPDAAFARPADEQMRRWNDMAGSKGIRVVSYR